MKKHLKLPCLTLAFFAFSSTSSLASDCGRVTVANGTWQSAEVLANVDQLILHNGFGCSVEFLIGDTVPIITSMVEKGQPDIMPEAWVDLMPDIMRRGVAEGRLIESVKSLPDGGIQGWWIPKYIADQHPDIKTVADVLNHPELFPAIEDSAKGSVINGPAGWGGTVATAQLFKAIKAENKKFVLVDSGSAAGLDGLITKAYERKKGFVTYYWSPTSLLGKYAMVKLDEGVVHDAAEWKRCTTVANCPDPKPNAWPVDHVYTLLSKPFVNRALPEVRQYFEKRAWSNETVSKIMAWMSNNQASGKEAARHFLLENGSLWQDWVSPKIAEKVKASL